MQKKPKGVRGYILFKILTAGIYTTFSRALREAVSNAFDAGATKVEITFNPAKFVEEQDPAELTVTIRDNGSGMSMDDFWGKFASIDSSKDPSTKNPDTGRFPIGRFGIGSFALTPFALALTLFSKKKGCPPIKCHIKAGQLQEEAHEEFPDHVEKNSVAEALSEEDWQTLSESDKPGTVIRIHGVTREAYAELKDGSDKDEQLFKGLYPAAKFTKGLREIAWELSTVLPVKYANDPGDVYKGYGSALKSNNPGIIIKLSGVELKRTVYSKEGCIVKTIDYDDKVHKVKAKGVLIALTDGVVQPQMARGIILRLNNVGVGSYRSFNASGNATLKNRITGEVHILKGLHKEINAPRESFSGPPFDALAKFLREKIEELISEGGTKHESRKATEREEFEKVADAKFVKLRKKRQKEAKAAPTAAEPSKKDPTDKPGAARPDNQPGTPSENNGDGKPGNKPASATTAAAKPDPAPKSAEKPGQAEEVKPDGQPAPDFLDPVMSTDHDHIAFCDDHPLFCVYKGKQEQRTIKLVLRALKLGGVPGAVYQGIIKDLLALREDDEEE